MSILPVIRRILLAAIALVLVVLAWGTISGGLHQLPRSHTVGQAIETIVQLACGLLSLLIVITCIWGRRWASAVHTAWIISLVSTVGLSSLVWGPPMLLPTLLFSVGTLLVALLLVRAIRRLSVRNQSNSIHTAQAAGVREDAA